MIYLITGEDTQLIQNKIKEVLKSENIDQFDITEYDGTDKFINIDSIIQDCRSLPMFSDKKLILINRPLFLTSSFSLEENDQKKFIDLIKGNTNDFHLILYGIIALDKRKNIYKALVKHSKVFFIEKLKPYEFNAIVKKSLNKYNIKIKPDALDELQKRLPIDLLNLKTEIHKLSSFSDVIELNDIKHLITRPLEDDIFVLTNAILDKNLNKSILFWKDLKKQNYDGLGATLILSTQVVFMYKVKYLASLGYSKDKIISKLKAHPYRVNIVLQKINKYSFKQLITMLNELAKLDQNVKSGRIEQNNGFELFIINMTR